MGTGHAISGASLWLAGWSWTAIAGLAEPGMDVLAIGAGLAAGAALLPDLDTDESRLAHAGGWPTRKFAKFVGWVGANVHAATKLDADRPDRDGHRTITHTLLFAVLAGTVITGLCRFEYTIGPVVAGKAVAAVLAFAFTKLGYTAIRSFWGGRRRKWKVFGQRWHKHTVFATLAAITTYASVPAGVWWIGLAVGAGCAIHCLGDMITMSGCPLLWPLPIPRTELRYVRARRTKVPVRVWRTWYLVGTPRWMRFRVTATSPAETVVSWALVLLACASQAGIIWSLLWGPTAQL